MKILVVGGAGFIGSYVADAYLNKGHEVFVIDDLSAGKRENVNPKAKFFKLSILNKIELEKVIKKIKPEIINLHAAQKSVSFSVEDPQNDALVNIIGALNVFESVKDIGVKKIIFASSGGAIYGDTSNIPTPESENEIPSSPYGIAKLAVEKYLHFYHLQYKIPYVALRYANVYGPRQDPKGEAGVIAIFVSRLLNNEKCTIFGDGKNTRDYVFVYDVAKANVLALKSNIMGSYNIATGKEISVNDLHDELKKLAESKLSPLHDKPKPGEQRRSCLSHNRAKKILGWQPDYDLKKGLNETIAFFKKNQ